jgi:hypothetical protein
LWHTASSDTNFIQIYMDRPPGILGVSKNQILQRKLLSSCAKIAPKRQKLWKSSKLKKSQKKPVFQKFFNLGAILAHQISNGMFSGSWRIIWHPWGPWGRIHIDDIKVLVFVCGNPYNFFQTIQNKVWSHLCWFMS